MDTTGVGHPDLSLDEVILREATEADASALELFDSGSGGPWLYEVAEIVHGLPQSALSQVLSVDQQLGRRRL